MQNGLARDDELGAFKSVSITNPVFCHPAGIKLTRTDYECEPPLSVLATMARHNDGICHLNDGFTVRRLGYGSVFWPGPFDLSDIDLDEVVHFRQGEVIVYPDEDKKPPVGTKLNIPAEVSLERIWPRNRATKQITTDPTELERLGFRGRLERLSTKMGAVFKDYRPETGTWVFCVDHFSKYGYLEESDSEEQLPTAEELTAALADKKIQFGVQRSKIIPKTTQSEKGVDNLLEQIGAKEKFQIENDVPVLNSCEMRSTWIASGLGGNIGTENSSLMELRESLFYNVDPNSVSSFHPEKVFDDQKLRLVQEVKAAVSAHDSGLILSDIVEESNKMEMELKSKRPVLCLPPTLSEPVHSLDTVVPLEDSVLSKMIRKKPVLIDCGIFRGFATRVGFGPASLYSECNVENSFNVRLNRLTAGTDKSLDHVTQLLNHSITLTEFADCGAKDQHSDSLTVPLAKQSRNYMELITGYSMISSVNRLDRGVDMWELCHALFNDEAHQNGLLFVFYFYFVITNNDHN
ncbi:hypothetical protein AB6A40_010400 [Gnathostoma spinigerum]|uniref:Peptidase S59 domain-containing protein n=1 Tax=Gnathostoma spinigerum TaxID=75299 RepID=A0ABD6EUZ0_9BILA